MEINSFIMSKMDIEVKVLSTINDLSKYLILNNYSAEIDREYIFLEDLPSSWGLEPKFHQLKWSTAVKPGRA